MKFTLARSWVFALTGALVGSLSLISGCVSEDDGNPATGGTSSGSGGSGASTGGGGASAMGGASGGDPLAVACPTPTMALMTDFSMPNTDGKGVSFGDFTNTFSGSTFQYPDAIVSDVTKGNWHLTGMVDNYAGLGIALQAMAGACTKFDGSAFKGIGFTVSGTVPGATGTVNAVEVWIGTVNNDIASSWLNAHKAAGAADVHNFGRCIPPGDNQYDGSCASAWKSVPVTATPTPVTILWSEVTGGKPTAGVVANELVAFGIRLPNPTGAGAPGVVPYELDLTIDDIKFIE